MTAIQVDLAGKSVAQQKHVVIMLLVMSTFGAMQDGLHSSIAKTSTFAVKTHCYIPGMDEYFIFKWKQSL